MEFYEFFERVFSYIPDDFSTLRGICETILPLLFGLFTLATCFLGHFMHKVWNACFFFAIGFFVPLFIIFAIFMPTGTAFWLLVAGCLIFGIFCAVFSHHLHRIKLFITTFLMVYITVSGHIITFNTGVAVIVGLVLGVIAAIISIRYKYITVLFTTAFTGSFMFWTMLEVKFSINHILILIIAVIMGVGGLLLQCYIEREELHASYDRLIEHSKKAKHAAVKIKNKVKK